MPAVARCGSGNYRRWALSNAAFSASAVTTSATGQVDAVSTGPASVAQQIKAGKLRALAHWGEKPLAAMPDVPSLKQSGYATSFAQWSALFVQSGVPEDIVQKLRAAAR